VQVGELALKVHQWRVISRDVARAARADAAAPGSLDHRGHDLRALPHAEVVIGAPDRDFGDHPVGPAPLGDREAARNALDVGENTVAPLIVQAIEGLAEVALVRLVRAIRVLRPGRDRCGQVHGWRSLPRHRAQERTCFAGTLASLKSRQQFRLYNMICHLYQALKLKPGLSMAHYLSGPLVSHKLLFVCPLIIAMRVG
jgi:hypothetical protein